MAAKNVDSKNSKSLFKYKLKKLLLPILFNLREVGKQHS